MSSANETPSAKRVIPQLRQSWTTEDLFNSCTPMDHSPMLTLISSVFKH